MCLGRKVCICVHGASWDAACYLLDIHSLSRYCFNGKVQSNGITEFYTKYF